MHLSDDQLQHLRQKLSDHGRQLNDKIMAVQAGKILPANETSVPYGWGDPEDALEVRMKKFLHLVQSKMKMIREGNADYGHCTECKAEFSYDSLDREPWLEKCDEHRG